MQEVTFVCKWTSEADEQFIKDWQFVENAVFNCFDDAAIKRKYFDNIYGPSLMVVAYLDGKPVGADAMWRNDVSGLESYESSDTCVLEEARGKGVMIGFTKAELATIPEGKYIYGSPNGKSYYGYKKLNWNIIPMYPAIFTCPKRYKAEYSVLMPKEYAEWWITGSNKYHIKRGGHYYLVSTNRSFLMNLIAEVDEETALMYPRYRKLAFFLYRSYKRPCLKYLKNHAMHHISWQGDPAKFPYWKIDGYCE